MAGGEQPPPHAARGKAAPKTGGTCRCLQGHAVHLWMGREMEAGTWIWKVLINKISEVSLVLGDPCFVKKFGFGQAAKRDLQQPTAPAPRVGRSQSLLTRRAQAPSHERPRLCAR